MRSIDTYIRMHALVYTRSSAPRTFRRGAYSLVDAARSHTVYIRKYVYMRCMNAFVLCIRCILGDIRLWVGDPSTSSFLVSFPRVYQRMHVLVYTWSSALRTVRRSAHQQFLRREVIYILMMMYVNTCTCEVYIRVHTLVYT